MRTESALLGAMAYVCVAHADFDVAMAVENGALQHWTVSADGQTWTQGSAIVPASSPVRQVAAPGDGYVYVPKGSTIDRYRFDGTAWTKADTWKSGLNNKVRLEMSPDRVWFYVGNDWCTSSQVARYRVSDPSIGGNLTLQGSPGFTNSRHLIFGRDGLLYVGARGNSVTDTTAANYGTANTTRGVMVFDPTVAGAPFRHRYRVGGNNNGIAVMPDDDHGRLYAAYYNYLLEFGLGGEDALSVTTVKDMSNPFNGADVGGFKFFSDYGGQVWKRDMGARTMTKIETVPSCNAISDISLVRTTDSRLPYINGVWYMNEAAGTTTLVNGANPGVWDMTLSGNAKAGATGACRGGVLLRGRNGGAAKGVIADSANLVPGTGDFTIGLWAFVGEDLTADRTLFSNGAASLGVTMSCKPYFRLGDGTELAIYGPNAIQNTWVWIVLRRTGGTFELWIDNVRVSSKAYDAATSIATASDWTLGARPAADGSYSGYVTEAFLDELRVYPTLLTTDDMTYLYRLVRPRVTAENATPIQPQIKVPVGWQASAAVLDGTAYLAVNDRLLAYDTAASAWSQVGTMGLSAASLFVENGALYAVGRNSAGLPAVAKATVGAQVNWSVPTALAGGAPMPNLVSTRPVLANGRVWLGMPAQGAWDPSLVSFAFSNGTGSDLRVARALVAPQFGTAGQIHVEMTDVHAAAVDGTVYALGASKRSAAVRTEALLLSRADPTASVTMAYDGAMAFPGGSKPFGLVYDSDTRRHWLVTAAWHRKDFFSIVPFFMATSLALYSSEDLRDWTFHGDFTVPGTGYYYRPTPLVLGDDLIVPFASAIYADDVRTLRIPDFRTLWKSGEKWRKKLLLADEDEQRVYGYAYDATTRDWIPAGLFCGGAYVQDGKTCTMGIPQTIRQWKDRVFVNSRSASLGVFEFRLDGRFVRHYSLPSGTDGLCVSQDGTKIYVTKWWGDSVFVIDRATGAVTERHFGTAKDTGLVVSRGIADLGDGRIAIGSRGNNQILVWEPENGDRITAYGSDQFASAGWQTTGNGPQDLVYDARTRRLWFTGDSCGTAFLDFSTETVSFRRLAANSYNGFAWWDETTFVGSVYSPGQVLQWTYDPAGNSFTADPSNAITAGRLFDRLCVVTRPPEPSLILFR